MRILKEIIEYRVESEEEAKELNSILKDKSNKEGAILTSFSYTKKEKKQKGEIIDDGYLVKATKLYGGFWDGLDD